MNALARVLDRGEIRTPNDPVLSAELRAYGGELLRRDILSVVRRTDQPLSSTARARLTFSRMSAALAVQTNGLGFSLSLSM